jgi:hypothetical protein
MAVTGNRAAAADSLPSHEDAARGVRVTLGVPAGSAG